MNPYEDWPFLKAVERAFHHRFGAQPGVARVFCGFVDHWGTLVGISVSIRPGQPRTRLPKQFLGFPVFWSYHGGPDQVPVK